MSNEIFIDGRTKVSGKRGHTYLGNFIKLSEAIQTVIGSVPSLSANPYTFENGLTATTTTGTLVKLGGVLTENTILDGGTSFGFKATKIDEFSVDADTSLISSKTASAFRTYNPPAFDSVTLKLETDAFVIESIDSISTVVNYELPTNDQPEEGDIMIMNANDKAVFVSYERDVQAEEIETIITGSTSNIYVPFNEGNWYLKRVTFWSFGVTTGDSFKFIIKDYTGTPVTAEKTVIMTERNVGGAGGAGIGFTEGANFTHVGAPDNYFLEITDDNTALPHSVTRITLSFIKTF